MIAKRFHEIPARLTNPKKRNADGSGTAVAVVVELRLTVRNRDSPGATLKNEPEYTGAPMVEPAKSTPLSGPVSAVSPLVEVPSHIETVETLVPENVVVPIVPAPETTV